MSERFRFISFYAFKPVETIRSSPSGRCFTIRNLFD
jgi:hypothetical protein